jgi:hypothetical protein
MRSVSAPKFLKSTLAVLESSVVPAVDDPAALRRLLICIGLLDNLVGRIEDRRSLVIEEAALLRTLIEPSMMTAATDVVLEPAVELRELRRAVSARLRGDSLVTPIATGEWLRRCQVVLTAINVAEMARLRPTRYALANSVGASSISVEDEE